jgi:hypothetical protein
MSVKKVQQPGQARRSFSDEFKRDAVNLVSSLMVIHSKRLRMLLVSVPGVCASGMRSLHPSPNRAVRMHHFSNFKMRSAGFVKSSIVLKSSVKS